jgi:hypothetical protein
MIRITFFFLLLSASRFLFAQSTSIDQQKEPKITIEHPTYDFGEIFQGDKVEHTFKFTNTGSAPLVITNVQVTCGCTTPKGWPRDPIEVGEKVELTIAFNSAGKMGRQNKVVTIVSNALGANTITFSATVLEKTIAKN